MDARGWLQIALYLALLTALVPVLGAYMARVYGGRRLLLTPVLGPLERLGYRALGRAARAEQDWKAYARSALVFGAAFWLVLYAILRTQAIHPFNPEDLGPAPWQLSFNTTSSFLTNANWQFYAGEATLSYFSQMAGLAVQNFVSAAVGMSALAAFCRGLASRGASVLGNFWRDLTRTLLYILLPLAVVVALFLASQGVIQTLGGYVAAETLAGGAQTLAMGPVASQEAIKMLGTNGGGFFGVNSAMPFENPTQLTNLVEMLLILLIPASLTATFGRMVGNRRQGWAVYAAMLSVLAAGIAISYTAEQDGSPAQQAAGLSVAARDGTGGGNMEGKEQRNGIASSAIWGAAATTTGNGAATSSYQAFTGIGAFVLLGNMMTGEVVFGGVGVGLYLMILFVILAVFVAGLMVGRTPEYLGKKLGAREMKLVLIGTLAVPVMVLALVALAIATPQGREPITQPGPQGFAQATYAYASQPLINGSAFAGYTGFVQPDPPGNEGAYALSFPNLSGGLAMLVGHYLPLVAALGVAGSLARKRAAPPGPGTFRTDTPAFVALLVFVVIVMGALSFFPALMLGPLVQGLTPGLF